jgi:hypothetical protein
VADLSFDEVADQTLTQLETSNDPRDRGLLGWLNAVVRAACHRPPGHSELHVELPNDVMIHYVGAASFA